MAYIYQIINDINGKVYIGMTDRTIEKRWKEHCQDRFRKSFENRPLYRAMNKYGIEHFHISLIEETDSPVEREKYWIEQKRSFKQGYNATQGGDGKHYLDYDVLIAAYKEMQNLRKVACLYHCDADHLSSILKANNIDIRTSQEVCRDRGQTISQFTKDGEYIKSFASAKEAAREVAPLSSSLGGVTSHITDVCKGKRKTAYGYIWRYASQ